MNYDSKEPGAGVHFVTLKNYCEKRENKCEVIMLKDFTLHQIKDMYERAKIVVADFLHSNERSVIEAVLAGTLVLTNHCLNGADTRYFPIPREHMHSDRAGIVEVAEYMMSHFKEEQAKLENFRRLYRSYGHKSIAEDTNTFLHQIFSGTN